MSTLTKCDECGGVVGMAGGMVFVVKAPYIVDAEFARPFLDDTQAILVIDCFPRFPLPCDAEGAQGFEP